MPSKLLGPHLAQDGPAVDLGGDLETDPGREVRLDRPGDHVNRRALCRHDQVNARCPRHLSQTLDAGFDLFACDHHQVGHLVNDDDNEGHFFGCVFLGLEHRFARVIIEPGLHRPRKCLAPVERILDAAVVPVDIANAHLGHLAITVFHFGNDPFQGDHSLLRVGHHRREQVRNAVIDAEFQHLGVNHDQAALIGRQLVEQRQDHGVDRHRFARPGGPGDQQVRHASKVGNDRLARDILAQRHGQRMRAIPKALARQNLAQQNHLAVFIGQFDADHRTPGDRGHARGKGRHRPRNVIRKADHTAGLQSGGRFKLVHGDHRARTNRDDFALHAIILQDRLQHPRILLQRVVGKCLAHDGRWVLQQRQGRDFVFAVTRVPQRKAGLFLGLGARALGDGLALGLLNARRRTGRLLHRRWQWRLGLNRRLQVGVRIQDVHIRRVSLRRTAAAIRAMTRSSSGRIVLGAR